MISEFTKNGGIKLHYLKKGEFDAGLTPLVYVPGTSGVAEDVLPIASALEVERQIISVSLRGRGQSDTPISGYSLFDNVSDIQAILENESLDGYCMLGPSIGGMYGLIHLVSTRSRAAGGIICDHPPYCKMLPNGWAENYAKLEINGRRSTDTIRDVALQCTEFDSINLDLRHNFSRIKIPVLIQAAHKSGIFPTLCKADIEFYESFGNVSIDHFYESTHLIRYCEPQRFNSSVASFLKMLDNRKSHQ